MNYWLPLYIAVSLFIAWIWVDYYLMLENTFKKKLAYILLAFFMGCASVLLIDLFHYFLLGSVDSKLNAISITPYLFTLFVGLPEEFVKLIPFFILLLLFKKQFTEPLDYIAFASFSALGFSASENVGYFTDCPFIIDSRSTLSSLGHMIDSSIAIYGIVLCKFKYEKFNLWIVEFGYVLIKPKTKGVTKTNRQYPIVSLLKIGDPEKLLDREKSITDFKFIEWDYIKPLA